MSLPALKSFFRVLSSLFALSWLPSSAAAQVSLTTLGAPSRRTSTRWPRQVRRTSGRTTARSPAGTRSSVRCPASPTTYRGGNGAWIRGAVCHRYGTGTATERAFGSVGPRRPGQHLECRPTRQQHGLTIASLDISLHGEQWRNGGNTSGPATATSSIRSPAPARSPTPTPRHGLAGLQRPRLRQPDLR